MPLIIDVDRTPPRWAQRAGLRTLGPVDAFQTRADSIKVALINNMPDAALEDTELQFFELLDAAADTFSVRLKLYSLPGIARSERAGLHLRQCYAELNELWNQRFDAVIITGTEPHQPNLRDEPYWHTFTRLIDWAERSTTSTILSCLAAHASVLHSDGIDRHPLSDKQFGVFDSTKVCEHMLTRGARQVVRFPHSRWNEVREQDLTCSGYSLLTRSAEAGADVFIKRKRKSTFVHFQGHPEYREETLFKEYRRDVKRFLKGERESYPSLPRGYFTGAAREHLLSFRDRALSDRQEEVITHFPDEATLLSDLRNTWQYSAQLIYGNWLHHVAAERERTPSLVAVSRSIAGWSNRANNGVS